MHVHLPKPVHGWGEFIGEVVIIVIGVLIALAADGAVDRWHWREQVKVADAGFHEEMGLAAQNAYERLIIQPCLQGRIAQLARKLNEQRPRWRAMPLAVNQRYYNNVMPVVYRPPYRPIRTNYWRNALGDETLKHLPKDHASELSKLYTVREEFALLENDELRAAARLTPLAYDRALDGQGRREMLGALAEVDRANALLVQNSVDLLRYLKGSYIHFGRGYVEQMREQMLKLQTDYRGECVRSLRLDLN